MATFDGETLIITLDSAVTSIDVKVDLYDAWKDWMLASPNNRKYPAAFRVIGGDTLTSIINAGSYFFIQNNEGWRIKPPEEDITISLSGNLAAEDSSLPVLIPTTGDYSVLVYGLQPVTQGVTPLMGEQLEFASFQNAVWIDEVNGTAGTGYTSTNHPIGTSETPSSNIDDAIIIATNRGLTKFMINGDVNITATAVLPDTKLEGTNKLVDTITVDTGADVTDCYFKHLNVTGTLDQNIFMKECVLNNISAVEGDIHNCEIYGTLTVNSGGAGIEIWNSYSGRKGYADPAVIDMGGGGANCAIHSFTGHLKIQNLTTSGIVGIHGSGFLYIDSTVTAGMIHIVGDWRIVDNSGGTAVVKADYVNTPDSIASKVWDALTADHDVTGSFGEKINDIPTEQVFVI